MDFETAQNEMRSTYVRGAPGVAISGLVWLTAGVVWISRGAPSALTALFVGGMAIFPLSMLASRLLFRATPASKQNPLNALGFETTVPLFAGLFVAFCLISQSAPLAFGLFAAIVGARYFAFATLYRDRTYWVLGAAMFASAVLFPRTIANGALNIALWIGTLEIVFSAVLFLRRSRA